MKKILVLSLVLISIVACSSAPGRVCGGKGGKRCVENTIKNPTLTSIKVNS